MFSQGETEKDEKKESPKYDLVTWGQLKPVKKQPGFYEISYTTVEKRRRKKMSAFVKLGDDLKVLQDRRLRSTKLEKGTAAYVLAKQRENSTVSAEGVEQTEWSLANVQAVLVGKGIKVNEEYRDPRDKGVRWYSTKAIEGKSGIWVELEKNPHRLMAGKDSLFLERAVADAALIEKMKKGFYAFILATDTDERPESKKKADAKKGAFETNRVILLDPSAVKKGLYYKLYK